MTEHSQQQSQQAYIPETTDALLSVKDLSVSFGTSQVVKHISFDIHPGETLALVGESGSGKSVTAHSILQLLPKSAHHPSGQVFFEGKDTLKLAEPGIRGLRGNRIGMIFQEPMTALNPLHTVEKQISEILQIHRGLNKQQCKETTLELLKRVKIPDPEQRLNNYPHELSGGQRQRIMIAMALANEPDLLIADEPTTALDVTVQKQIMELLEELKSQSDMAILLITHDLAVVRHFADRVCVMHQGQLVETNTCESLFRDPQAQYTQELLESTPKGGPTEITSEPEATISTCGLAVKFPLHKPLFKKPSRFLHALNPCDITINRGQTLGVVGESGSGKSTLAMAILRLIGSEGAIDFQGERLDQLRQKELIALRRKIQVVFQDPFASLSPRMSIAQIIAEGLRVHEQLTPEQIDERVVAVMKTVELDPETRHRFPHEFSGGQRQRVAIARAVILEPEVIFLDEPTSALDRAVQVQVIDLLRKLQRELGLTYVFISHDIPIVKAISHQVLVLKAGDIVERGDAASVLNSPQHPYTQELLASALAL